MVSLIGNITELGRLFSDVATASANPIPAILLLLGAVFVGFSVLFLAYLTVGGIGSALITDAPGRAPPQ